MGFSPDFIENYASRRDYTYSETSGMHEHAYYAPPANGIHLCGSDINDAAASAAIYPMSADCAAKRFATAKNVAECASADEADFVVDLCVNGEIVDDFWTSRQLWPLAIAEWNAP